MSIDIRPDLIFKKLAVHMCTGLCSRVKGLRVGFEGFFCFGAGSDCQKDRKLLKFKIIKREETADFSMLQL